MIDFENVRSNGLRGADLLEPNDYVTLLFSSVAYSCENCYLEEIEQSRCAFDICKLVKTEKKGKLPQYGCPIENKAMSCLDLSNETFAKSKQPL